MRMVWNGNLPTLYPILDSSFLPDLSGRPEFLKQLLRHLADAGVKILQYRNKSGNQEEILADARCLRATAGNRLLLIMNDWPTLAVEAGFDGVHVGQTDIKPTEARRIVGPERIVGVSTHNEAQLRAADTEPVDYIAYGPIFATSSKQNPDPVVGLDGLSYARTLTQRPLVAIGGITPANAGQVCAAGADSIAVISAVFAPGGNPAKLAGDFLAVFR